MGAETWARVSLRITSNRLATPEIEHLMGRASSSRRSNLWAIDVSDDSTIKLNEQLQIAKEYLRSKVVTLEGMADCEINLSISWTPRSPQDGVVLDTEMLALLARIRGYVLLDTYLD